VNGGAPEIEIFRPFGEAVELTKKILFQPFDLKKWFIIGFAAWLSNLGGYNFSYRFSNVRQPPVFGELSDAINQIPHWFVVLGLVLLITLILGITAVFAWLRARGRFMFIDCVVKNRGAIAEPWRELREQGNSYFLFSLLIGFVFLIAAAVCSVPFMLPFVRGVTFLHMHDFYLTSMIVLWAAFIFLFILVWALIAHLMVVAMYRHRCHATEGLRSAVSLIASYPGEITLYCVFWIALALASVMVVCTLTLATCCFALLPYLGTVIMLPLFVCLRSFGLLFLRQFGSDYDVWSGIPPLDPRPIPGSASASPPPLPS
jgi:hypothetical protein